MRCDLCGNHVQRDTETGALYENDGSDMLDYLCIENPESVHVITEPPC